MTAASGPLRFVYRHKVSGGCDRNGEATHRTGRRTPEGPGSTGAGVCREQVGHTRHTAWSDGIGASRLLAQRQCISIDFCSEFCTIRSLEAPMTKAIERFSELVNEVAATGAELTITKHGRPVAVLIAHDKYEGLVETVNILSDPDAMAAVAEAESDIEAGRLVDLP